MQWSRNISLDTLQCYKRWNTYLYIGLCFWLWRFQSWELEPIAINEIWIINVYIEIESFHFPSISLWSQSKNDMIIGFYCSNFLLLLSFSLIKNYCKLISLPTGSGIMNTMQYKLLLYVWHALIYFMMSCTYLRFWVDFLEKWKFLSINCTYFARTEEISNSDNLLFLWKLWTS